jgi:hypothetical protein
MPHGQSLRIELGRSVLLAGVVGAAHAAALVATAASLRGWSLILVAAGIALSAAASLALALHRSAAAAREIELHEDGRCAWRDGDGRWHEATDRRLHFVSPWLIIVALRTELSRSKWIVIFPDSSDRESLRRLRAWLRGTIDAPRLDGGPDSGLSASQRRLEP